MKTVFKNAMISGKITDITVHDGKIHKIGKSEENGFDLKGCKVYAGLIDVHTHGCMGYDVMDGNPNLMSKFYAKSGVTSYLPTTMTGDAEKIRRITETDIFEQRGSNILGFHLEGPYISDEYKGAQNGKYIKNPDLKEFEKFKNVKMVTVAPELEGSLEFIKNCNCIVSLGHTAADYNTAMEAFGAGACCLTHTFNAMPPLHHRNPSLIGAAFDKNAYVQVICDGLHIHPSVIRMLYKMFGSDRMILISDSMRATGLSDGTYELGGQTVTVRGNSARLADGTLAGSVSTLLDCVKCAVRFGISEAEAFKMASLTPAKLLGVNKGKLAEGYDADFIALDNNLNLVTTVINGKVFC